MTKQNQDINLFIIEEDYKRRRANQNRSVDYSGKAVTPILTKPVIDKYEEMHLNFELPQKADTSQFADSTINPDTAELLESLQKANAEEQKLLEIKQNLIETQQELQNKLKEELDKKKKTIANLVTEIPTLQNKCQQLSNALGTTFEGNWSKTMTISR